MRYIVCAFAVTVAAAGPAPAVAAPKLTVLQDLTVQTGGGPEFPPIIGPGDALYGTTYTSNNGGAIYSIDTAGKNFAVLYAFPGGAAGSGPYGGLSQDSGGLLYGTTLFGGTSAQGTVYQFDPATQTETVLHAFDVADGSTPYAGLVQDAAGNFYGTTSSGGANNLGTIFRIGAGSHAFTKLADLDSKAGGAPFSPVLVGRDGFLYGTATMGGSANKGTIFRLPAAGGKVELLYSFKGPDGSAPFAGLTEGRHGVFYGTTDFGGTNNAGTLFAFKPRGGTLSVLHSFAVSDGEGPQGAVALDRAGRVFGTTFAGGKNNGGVVYSYDPATSSFAVLDELNVAVAGSPNAGLTYAGGRTFFGGALNGGVGEFEAGAIFKFLE